MQHGWIGTRELSLDGIFLEHQVVAFHFDIGIRETSGQLGLDLVEVVYQPLRRGEIDDQLAVGQRGIRYATYQVVASRCATDGGGDVGDLRTALQVSGHLP